MTKTVTVFAATGALGTACVEGLLAHDDFEVRVLIRDSAQEEKASVAGVAAGAALKEARWNDWRSRGVEIRSADITDAIDLIPALAGTDYLVSCAPINATESQYPLIWAAKEAGVQRFVPSEYGFIYEHEQSLPTPTVHRAIARQKVFVRDVIELAGLDYTIIPAGLWPEYYMVEPVAIMGDPHAPVSWSLATDVGRIIPQILAHPSSRNATCPVAATAYCSWNELLEHRERLLNRPIGRQVRTLSDWRSSYGREKPGPWQLLLAMGVSVAESLEGNPLWGNWNSVHLPDFRGTGLDEAFAKFIEPATLQMERALSRA